MPARRKLTTFNRGRAIAWLHDGVSKCKVARQLGVSHSVIVRLNQRFQTTNNVEERPRSGRPKMTTPREDRFIQRQALQHRATTCKVIRGQLREATNINVSERTIGNRLHDARLRSRRPAVRPLLTQVHRRARLAWSRRHLRWTRRDWAQVLFSDESRFNLYHSDGRRKVWRREGERYEDDTVHERVAFCGGSVMVWGGFSLHQRTPLYHVVGNLTGQRYRDEILAPIVLPTLQQIGPNAVFQDDNATPHRARLVNDYIQQTGVVRMDFPACSPDMNPIEHVWDELDRQVRANHQPPRNLQQLLQMLQQEWQAIPQAFFTKLMNSMRSRCGELERKRGGHTHY
ncbi:hypothetical protein V1264_015566 [Littorina saxatilis]|uniref:Transposase n=1 Tax=Littorina saxatilis TaxID=31220 RepID=A0AAN9GGX7_9CAEN